MCFDNGQMSIRDGSDELDGSRVYTRDIYERRSVRVEDDLALFDSDVQRPSMFSAESMHRAVCRLSTFDIESL